MKNIMIVDDNEQILEVLGSFFEDEGFNVATYTEANKALEIIKLHPPDLIISDIKMSPLNGIQFLHTIKKEGINVPFIFITAFADLLLIDEAIQLGALSLFKKPFDFEVILKTVKKALNLEGKAEGSKEDEKYCRIDLKRFISGSKITCSVFIKLRANHYVKLAHKGDPLPKQKLEEYQKKNLSFLYVLKEEFSEFVGFNLKVLKALENNTKIDNEKAVNFVHYTNQLILEKTFVNELDQLTMNEVLEYSNLALSILRERKSLFNMIQSLSDHSEKIYAHSLSTAILSFLIAKKVGWINEPTLFKCFLSGLFHDIGIKEIKKEVLDKNPTMWTEEEKSHYETHSTRGMEILNKLGGIPEEVILAAYQHHEDLLGHGYPLGLQKSKISPISKLVTCADIICDRILGDSKVSFSNYRTAYAQISKFKLNHFDQDFLQALEEILEGA